MLKRRQNGIRKESITLVRGGHRPQRMERDEGVITPSAVATGGGDQRQRTLWRRFLMLLGFQLLEVEQTRKVKANRGFFFSFFLFFFYIIYSLLRYKKSHGALAMAKTKPKSQHKLTKEKTITKLFIWGPYRSQAHIRARN